MEYNSDMSIPAAETGSVGDEATAMQQFADADPSLLQVGYTPFPCSAFQFIVHCLVGLACCRRLAIAFNCLVPQESHRRAVSHLPA